MFCRALITTLLITLANTASAEEPTWIIDRIEGDIAVVEADDTWLDIPLSALPEGVTEGMALRILPLQPSRQTAQERLNRLRSRETTVSRLPASTSWEEVEKVP